MKIIEKSGYQALPWVRYITQSGGKNSFFNQALILIRVFLKHIILLRQVVV